MGGKSGQTIGYRYFMSLLSGLCRGPIDELVMIKAGDEIAWDGHACGAGAQFINKPDLFGGEKKEGGVVGPFRVFMGEADQVLPGAIVTPNGTLPDLKQQIGGRVSDFRGVVTLWFDGMICAMNPYVKEWSFRVRRSSKGWYTGTAWYAPKATIFLSAPQKVEQKQLASHGGVFGAVIQALFGQKGGTAAQPVTIIIPGNIHAMNPAHIIYECCTNPQWGRGLPISRIDDNSFTYAANTLCNEGFGLCIAWYRKEDLDQFIQKICDLAGMSLYTDRETGLTVLRLIRDDYDPNDLPLFTPDTGLLEIVEDDSGSQDTTYNEIIGTSVDPIENKDIQERAQNAASFQAQQAVQSLDQDYKGIPTRELLARVVQRDMRVHASGLKKFKVVLDRRGWRVAPAMPFRISDPRRSIDNIVLRAGEISEASMTDGRITIKAVQDVFGLPETTFTTPSYPQWVRPGGNAVAPAEQRVFEASWRDIYRMTGEASAEAMNATDAYLGVVAAAPNSYSYQFDLATQAVGETEYVVRTSGSFTGFGRVTIAVKPTDTMLQIGEISSFDESHVGEAVMLGDEVMDLVAYDPVTKVATVARGCADSIPASHPVGSRLWTLDDDIASDRRKYVGGETVSAKVLTRTSRDALPIADAVAVPVAFVARQARPYPPGKVEVDGTSVFVERGLQSVPVFTWTSRNRIGQADALVDHYGGSVPPEAGTTYTIRIYDATSGTLLRTTAAIATLSWTYDATMQTADADPQTIRVEIESVRDGAISWQKYSFTVILKGGWGQVWNNNWGI